jgi:phage tail tape-measure protein
MTRAIRTLGIALLVLALAALVGAGPAAAKKKKVHGTITIAYEPNPSGPDRFFGTLGASNPRCVRGAVVNLGFRPAFEGGGGSDTPRTTVASTRSDTAGNWQVSYEVTPNPAYDFQSYSADSPTRTLKTKKKGVKLVCKFAASEVLTLFPG